MWPWAEVIARFALSGDVRELVGERTANAALIDASGQAVAVLKLHPTSEADDIGFESAALEHLAAHPALSGRVPRVLRTPAGEAVIEQVTPDGVRLARALTWLPGRTWTPSDATAEALRALGTTVAEVDTALAAFEHPHAGRLLRWNLVEAGRALDLIGYVPDADRREVARAVLQEFVDQVAPRLARLPWQVIHNDANDANIVLDDTARPGLIDFGDLCRAPRVCGLAVACAYAIAGRSAEGVNPWAPAAPLIQGYQAVAPLDSVELELLPALVRTRLALSVVMAGWQHSRDPGNDYLLASQDAVAPALQRLSTTQSSR
ncbi:MAG: phosphotransferase [Kineosporiaceae bacterium]|nr:phosphotransferase [Kineosporiaceae bacterium]